MTKETRHKLLASAMGTSRFVANHGAQGVQVPLTRPGTERANWQLARTVGCVRYVDNWALPLRIEAWFECHERIDDSETERLLVRMKKETGKAWLAEVFCVPLQQALRHLYAAFVNFFVGRAKYPRFHHKRGRQWACGGATGSRRSPRWMSRSTSGGPNARRHRANCIAVPDS